VPATQTDGLGALAAQFNIMVAERRRVAVIGGMAHELRAPRSIIQEAPTMMGGYGMMAGFGWLGMLMMALFWIAVVVLLVWGLTSILSARQPRGELNAEEILKQRYARGEISRQEYLQASEMLYGSTK
jgi:putative membrane protein